MQAGDFTQQKSEHKMMNSSTYIHRQRAIDSVI